MSPRDERSGLPITTPAQMREVDANAGEPVEELIARAAWQVARCARSMLGGVYGRHVTVIAGPGNNGEDGRVAAEILRRWGVRVEVVGPDTATLPPADLVIDGAFGTGVNRPYVAPRCPRGAKVLAIDIPSGVDGLTGELVGRPLKADRTITFAALKPGLVLPPGSDYCGAVEVVGIGLDVGETSSWLMHDTAASSLLPRRPTTAHKWNRAVFVIGGSSGMMGAPMLASRAALRSGAGMVWCGVPGQTPSDVASEVVFRALPAAAWDHTVLEHADRFGSLVVGCGLGRDPAAGDAVRSLVAKSELPMVIDGDALRLLGPSPRLRPSTVLTPHDGEFAALTGSMPGPDRFAAARSLAKTCGATVLLKGPLSIAAAPDGTCIASDSGDQRLATAGTGDVLAGVIGSYLAGGVAPTEAAALGAWVHGESCRSQMSLGMVASDLIDGLPAVGEALVAAPSPNGETHAPY